MGKSLDALMLRRLNKKGALPGQNIVVGVMLLVLILSVLGIVLLFIFSMFGTMSTSLNPASSLQANYTTAAINNGSIAIGSVFQYMNVIVLVGILVLIIFLVSIILFAIFRFSGNTGGAGGMVG